jgi:hypothetical protein
VSAEPLVSARRVGTSGLWYGLARLPDQIRRLGPYSSERFALAMARAFLRGRGLLK